MKITQSKELSLDRVMGEGNFTLKDVIKSSVDEFEGQSSEPNVKIKQARRSIEIDNDVTDAIRKQFGNMPLGAAIRIMVGLKPKIAQNGWQEEEDALIKEHYADIGAPPLAKVLDRSADCIRGRAAKLGVKRVWLYKRDRRCQIRRH